MKQMKNKIISLSLALALALGVFAGAPVYAEGEETQPDGQTPGTITNTDKTGGGEGGGSTSEPSPTKISIVNYDIGGGFGAHLRPGEKANISITVSDEWAQGKNAGLRGRINTSSFSGKDAIAEKRSDGTYKFVFTDVTYNGGSNEFSFDVITEGGDEPREVQQLTQTIIQCAEAIEPTPAPTPAPAEVPKIMVKDFTFGGNSVEAGKEFTLELTLFTTSGNTNLEDVMVGLTFPTDSKNVSLASGSMNTYVGAMAPNETRTISYKMVTDATMEPGSVNITVQLTSKNGEAATSPISIPVTQPERFEITNVEAPETMMMGEEGYLSVTFVNKGKSAINNLTAEIQGENLANPGQSQFLGNVAAGTENSVDFSVMASAEGVINGKVILSYENSKGEVATLEKEFSCTVEAAPVIDDPGMMDPGMMDPTMGDDVNSGMPIWGWALIVVGVGAVVAVVVVVIRKKKAAKKLAELEDEDEDI